jgi:hypothetical protein
MIHPQSWFPIILGVSAVCSGLALRRAVRDGQSNRALAEAMLLAWVVGLLVATPLYRPYPRLTLPLAVGALLTCSVLWRRGWAPFTATTEFSRRAWLGPAALLTTVFLVGGWRGSIVWEDRTYYQAAARQLELVIHREARKASTPSVVYASGEPALVYWLHSMGIPAANSASLDVHGPPGVHTDLAIGPVTRTSAEFATDWDRLSPQFEQIAVIRLSRLKLSSIVLLDHDAAVRARLRDDAHSLTLWQRK